MLFRAYRKDLTDPNPSVRRKAAKGLGRLVPPAVEAIPAVEEALKDQHPMVREAAACALGKLRRHDQQNLPDSQSARAALASEVKTAVPPGRTHRGGMSEAGK